MALVPKENLVKASNMIFISTGLAMIRLVIYLFQHGFTNAVTTPVVSVGIFLLLAFFVRIGFEWARWLYIILLTIGVFLAPFAMVVLFASDLVAFILYAIQIVLQVYAGILIFRKRESGNNYYSRG